MREDPAAAPPAMFAKITVKVYDYLTEVLAAAIVPVWFHESVFNSQESDEGQLLLKLIQRAPLPSIGLRNVVHVKRIYCVGWIGIRKLPCLHVNSKEGVVMGLAPTLMEEYLKDLMLNLTNFF
jgi:hypothetical protein